MKLPEAEPGSRWEGTMDGEGENLGLWGQVSATVKGTGVGPTRSGGSEEGEQEMDARDKKRPRKISGAWQSPDLGGQGRGMWQGTAGPAGCLGMQGWVPLYI